MKQSVLTLRIQR